MLARVAKHEKSVLNSFEKELQQMNKLFIQKDILNNINDDEVEALKEDVDYVNSKINK